KPKDFLFPGWILWIPSNTNPCIHVRGELRTSEKERVSIITQNNFGEHSPFDNEIKAGILEFFFEPKDLIKDAWLFRIGLLKRKRQEFYLGPLDILWKVGRRALQPDADFFSRDNLLGIVEPVEDSSMDVFNESSELNGYTFIAEISAAPPASPERERWRAGLVPGIGGPPARRVYASERKRVPSVARIL
ncbi:MAG: hypothetical protein V3U20_09890, partial [Thermoplasmata archaeon]